MTRLYCFIWSFQLVAETYLVALLYACVTAGMILINDAADGKGDPSRRRSQCLCLSMQTRVLQ